MVKDGGGKPCVKTVEGEAARSPRRRATSSIDAKGAYRPASPSRNVMQSNGVIHVIDTVLLPG